MEIVVKAKQANNPLFQFLHFDCVLHPFYRHVLNAIRNGTYVVVDEDETKSDDVEKNNHSDAAASDSDGDHYLHPSLQTNVVRSLALELPDSILTPLMENQLILPANS